MMLTQTIRREVKQLVKTNGLRETARKVKIDPSHLKRWCEEDVRVSTDVLDLLAKHARIVVSAKTGSGSRSA